MIVYICMANGVQLYSTRTSILARLFIVSYYLIDPVPNIASGVRAETLTLKRNMFYSSDLLSPKGALGQIWVGLRCLRALLFFWLFRAL